MSKTLYDKIWQDHIVHQQSDGTELLYVDRHLVHEVTSPQAFEGLRLNKRKVRRPDLTLAVADHNVPTTDRSKGIVDEESRIQVDTLKNNCKEFSIELFDMNDKRQGIVHIIGPEQGFTQPGTVIVCGDSHTATHGAFGALAFGIGTSEVEMVLSTQCVMQPKPKKMRIIINGTLSKAVTPKDVALYIISKLSTAGATGYFVEYSGEVFLNMSMEGRMTVCNLSIEMGARGGIIAPDNKTFEYIKDREFTPKEDKWKKAMNYWKTLKTDTNAIFDKEISFEGSDITPMITYGTNPGMGMGISNEIPKVEDQKSASKSYFKSLDYMNYDEGESMIGKKIDFVFLGSCTNGRIEDFRDFAKIIKGRKKADNVTAWLVPGSHKVEKAIKAEGILDTLEDSGFQLREPGCSACLAMNDDKIPKGKYAVSTSNRNFEGRQGPGSRTILASPLVAAAAAVTGMITDPRTLF